MPRNKSGYVNANDLSREAALEAVRIFQKEEKEKVRKKSLYNVGLLMNHYLDFIDHYEKIKYRTSDLHDYLENMGIDVRPYDELSVEAIKRSKTRTLIIITQIQTAVNMLKADMEAKDEIEKYQVIKMLYMDPSKKDITFSQRVKLIAEEIKCGESSVRRWNTEMLNKLAVKLFGIDGLRLDV